MLPTGEGPYCIPSQVSSPLEKNSFFKEEAKVKILLIKREKYPKHTSNFALCLKVTRVQT